MHNEIVAEQINSSNEERWNRLLMNSIYPSYRQSLKYEYAKQLSGRETVTFIFVKNNVDIAGVHYSIKRSKFNLITTADVLSGWVFKEDPSDELVNFLANHFENFASSKKAAYIRLSPWLTRTIAGEHSKYEKELRNCLQSKGFNEIKSGRHTYWIDLTLSDDELLNNLKPQTRRHIKKAEKAGLVAEYYNQFLPDKIQLFWELYHSLGLRKEFEILNKQRFFAEIEALFSSGAVLIILKCQDIVINVALASSFGIASYYHGALNPAYKELKDCPAPGHYMQWLLIMHLKKMGLKTYDMAFCPGPVPIESHPNYNMWRFKYGFGGKHIQFTPTYGKVIRPLRGRILKYWLTK